jgi:hypothetical protein
MVIGEAVVSTSVGTGAIPVKDGANIQTADSAVGFARSVGSVGQQRGEPIAGSSGTAQTWQSYPPSIQARRPWRDKSGGMRIYQRMKPNRTALARLYFDRLPRRL